MAASSPARQVDSEARERIAELAGRLSAHERHCEERHNNLRDFMAQIDLWDSLNL